MSRPSPQDVADVAFVAAFLVAFIFFGQTIAAVLVAVAETIGVAP